MLLSLWLKSMVTDDLSPEIAAGNLRETSSGFFHVMTRGIASKARSLDDLRSDVLASRSFFASFGACLQQDFASGIFSSPVQRV